MEHKINKKIYEKFLSKIKTILNKTICWDDTVTNKYIFYRHIGHTQILLI